MPAPASVNVVRLTYVLVCEFAGAAIALGVGGYGALWIGLAGGLLVCAFFILVESLMKGFTLRGFSTATFGFLVGLFCAWLLTRVGLSELVALAFRIETSSSADLATVAEAIRTAIDTTLYASLGFLGAVLALRSSRDDFAFIIPYVRFRQDSVTGQPVVLDPESVIDGRVARIVRSGFLNGRLIVPRFVLDELQVLAESPSVANRTRGQRGLAALETMQADKQLEVSIHDSPDVGADETIDSRLVQTALLLGARLLTPGDNLAKVARLRGVDVLHIEELADALRPAVAVGEKIRLALVRPGKEEHQAVGYLPDGTMIVVNHAAAKVGSSIDVLVLSTLQTAAGVMVFAEPA